jgi:hypothetical protein
MESTAVEATTDNLANASRRAHRHAFSSFVYAPVPTPGRLATADATHRKATIFLIVILHAEAARTVGGVGTA